MISRHLCRRWGLVAVLGLGLVGAARPAAAEAGPAAAIEVAGLEDQLTAGLKARLPSEFTFVRHVVEKVQAEELPLELVMSTFQWARRKQPYPFPYFERALRARAAARGIIF